MPFIGIYRNLFPSSNKEEKKKDIISVTILPKREHSVFAMEAVDDKGNKYDIVSTYYRTFFKNELKFKFKGGDKYLAEVDYLYSGKPDSIGCIGRVRIIKISTFGSINYL